MRRFVFIFLCIPYLSFTQSPFMGLVLEEVDNTAAASTFVNGEKTYRLYAELNSGLVNQMFGDETHPHLIETSTSFYRITIIQFLE